MKNKVGLVGILLLLTCSSRLFAQDYQTDPFQPGLLEKLKICRELALDEKAASDPFVETLRSCAPALPLVSFNYTPGELAFVLITLNSPVGFDAFLIRIPEGRAGLLYSFTPRPPDMLLRSWYARSLDGQDFDPAGTYMPFIASYANRPWPYDSGMLIAQPWDVVKEGQECVFWFTFDGKATQTLYVSMKILPEGEKPDGWAGDKLHGLEKGRTPKATPTANDNFREACRYGHAELMKETYRQGGVDIDYAFNNSGENPMAVSIDKKRMNIVNLLLDLGADPNAAVIVGRPALAYAAMRDNLECMDLLLRRGASLEHTNVLGTTALGLAASIGKANAVCHLLELGADPTRSNRFGKTALDLARENGHAETIAMLENAEATARAKKP